MDMIYKEESYEIIGACMDVHSELGMGFLEPVYHEALINELEGRKIPFINEAPLTIMYKGNPMHKKYFADLICFDKIIVEIKAVKTFLPEHEAQLFNYLKATGFKLGLLVNFSEPSFVYKRIVCSNYFKPKQ